MILAPLLFHINLRIILSIAIKNLAEVFKGIALNLYINLGRTDVFTMLSLSINEHGMSLHLFVFFDLCDQHVVLSMQVLYTCFVRFIPMHFIYLF